MAVKEESAVDVAAGAIRARIRAGEFAAGARLPRETDLAADLGVSRNALREAIRTLEAAGVLRVRHGSGTFVTGLSADDLLGGLGANQDLLTLGSAAEVVEFRRIVEPEAARLAAARATPAQLEAIRAAHADLEAAVDPAAHAAADDAFHRAILAASGNAVLVAVTTALAYGPAWQEMWRRLTGPEVPAETRYEHRRLLLALEAGDGELARVIAHAHVAAAAAAVAADTRTDPENR